MLITLLWTDGTITTGRSWSEVENAVRATQWQPFKTRREFRQELRNRAENWSGHYPRGAFGPSRRFLTALAKEGLFQVFTEPDDAAVQQP